MQIYGGKSESASRKEGLGSKVVKDLLKFIQEPKQVEVYFDNFFNSYQLLNDLKTAGFKAIGTVRDNRIRKCPVKSVKLMKKEARGKFDYRCDGTVYVCRWMDNAVVTLASNHVTHLPSGKVKRYSRRNRKRIDITVPNLVCEYNAHMGGVDTFDQLLASYRPKFRCKKWWWPLFTHALNMATVAASKLHCELHNGKERLTHLDFRREVVLALLRKNPRLSSRPGHRAIVMPSVLQTGNHFLVSNKSQTKCKLCKKKCKAKV